MPSYVYRNGKVVEKGSNDDLPDHVGPYIISDIMPEMRHMATGRYHTSKSKFREDTKASGCVEYGNDPALTRPRKPIPLDRNKRRDDIRRTIYDLRNGRVPQQ